MKTKILASLLLTALFYFFCNCKKTPTTPAAPAAPELPNCGSIQVDSNPTKATIWLDNEDTGEKTPALLTNISLGSHTIKLTKNCYQHFETTVAVEKDQTAKVNAELEKAIPKLIAPEEGAVLDNGRTDRKDYIKWFFSWSPVGGAVKYNLYVKHKGAKYPLIDKEITSFYLSYNYEEYGAYIADWNRFNWRWKLRAYVNDMWCDWSEVRSFNVEPVNTDPPSYE